MSEGVSGYVATTGKAVNLANAYDHSKFNPAIDILTQYRTVSLLCVPIFGPDGHTIGVGINN